MIDVLTASLSNIVRELFNTTPTVVMTRPEERFGDYASNIALQLSGSLDQPPAGGPRAIAEQIAEKLRTVDGIASVEIAGPGFINIRVDDGLLSTQVQRAATAENYGLSDTLAGKVVVVEYSDPNPFKVLHAGHLYTSVVGDAIANLYQLSGAQVHRVNFGGDVGLHVGKTMWAILRRLEGEHPEKLFELASEQRSEWMAAAYVEGSNAYEDDEQAKQEIVALNKRIYAVHAEKDHGSSLAQIYWTCRDWSYDYFKAFYARIGTEFERFYPESEVADLGLQTVREQLAKGVFADSDGAVVFRGDDHGLHTRVFINGEGLPTYEAKDVGLIFTKWHDYRFDTSVVITGNEQEQYMAVVLKAIEQFAPELAQKTRHLTHGIVKLEGAVKMSSRKGNILRAVDVIDTAAEAHKKLTGKSDERIELGAVKYAFLKQRTGGDIIYNPEESVSLQGNSGPYLQYAHARARSILAKVTSQTGAALDGALEAEERSLARKISEYPEVVSHATQDMMPHHICTYLYELAQVFNRFYENNRVLEDPREAVRANLVLAYANTLRSGLQVMGIEALERM